MSVSGVMSVCGVMNVRCVSGVKSVSGSGKVIISGSSSVINDSLFINSLFIHLFWGSFSLAAGAFAAATTRINNLMAADFGGLH